MYMTLEEPTDKIMLRTQEITVMQNERYTAIPSEA